MKRLIPFLLMLALPAGAAYIALEDMRAGLDARKGVASAPAGTLREALNGHITPGGEFEKRKAFVQTSLPSGTYGLEAITNGLVTFGSDADPGGWPRGQVVQYQQLQHPAVLEGATYNATYHNLTGIVWSVCHEGLPYAAAAFSDGRQFLYYNGQLVADSRNGLALNGFTSAVAINTNLALNVVSNINSFDSSSVVAHPFTHGFSSGDKYYWSGTSNSALMSVYFAQSNGASFEISASSISGKAEYQPSWSLSFDYATPPPFFGTNPIAVLTVQNNYTNGGIVVYGYLPQRNYLSNILAGLHEGPVSYTTPSGTATAIAAAINGRTTFHLYTAEASGSDVIVRRNYDEVIYSVEAQITDPLTVRLRTPAFVNVYSNYSFTTPYKVLNFEKQYPFAFDGEFSPGESWSGLLVYGGNTYTLGAGNISGKSSLSGFSHKNRVYLTLSNEFGFSSITDSTKFENHDTGAGVVTFSSTFGALDTVEGIGEYQGGIAVAGKLTTQLWNTDPDPADFYLRQTLPIGTVSGQTIQALGKLDTLMLSGSGVRSLRVRDSSGNAIVEDVGTPIDSFVQAAMAGLTETQKRAACATVDPASGRYWVYIPGNYIYVFSFHPLSGISAWTRYAPTFIQSATNTWFAPQKFTVYAGQIFARSTNAVYAYGGTGGTNYDACTMLAETPFLNGNTPGTYKSYGGMDLISEGIWTAKLGANLASDQSYVTVIAGATNSTVTTGRPGLAARATHFKVRLEESGTGYARLSSVLLYYQPGDSR